MKDVKYLRVSAVVFKVLAWLSLAIQIIVGVILLVMGGPDVPIGGVDIPARLVGVLNCVGGAIYFFFLLLISKTLRVLLDVHQRVGGGSGAG